MFKVIKSFNWALNGLKTVWLEEINFRLECLIAVLILVTAIFFDFSFTELLAIIVAIIFVISAEIINTAVEDLCNKVQPNQDPLIGKVKDIMAGYVLIVSLGASVIGLLVLAHHFLNYF
jgi:diacylglycerol kinase